MVNNLGNLYESQGKLVEAEGMYKRALEAKKKALGPIHMSMLDTINKSVDHDQHKLSGGEGDS